MVDSKINLLVQIQYHNDEGYIEYKLKCISIEIQDVLKQFFSIKFDFRATLWIAGLHNQSGHVECRMCLCSHYAWKTNLCGSHKL